MAFNGCSCRRTFSGVMLSAVVLLVCLSQSLCLDTKLDGIKNVLVKSEPVELQWGVADTTAVLGHAFHYHIPGDAFKGEIKSIKISVPNSPDFPSWLAYDETNRVISGVPGPNNLGPHTLKVTAIGKDNSQADDIFTITVTKETTMRYLPVNSRSPQTVRCKRQEPQTVVTVIIDADLEKLHPLEKLNLIKNFESHLSLAHEMLQLLPIGDKSMFDSSALVAGPGNSKEPQHPGAFMSWLVGCGKVEPDHMAILQNVETNSGSGDMAKSVGHPILGWQVTNTRFQVEKTRKKRAAHQTATLSMDKTPPTITEVVTDTMTRKIPSMETSTIIQPTTTYEPSMKTDDVIMPMDKTTTQVHVTDSKTKTEILPTKPTVMTSKPIDEMTDIDSHPTKVTTLEPTNNKVYPVEPCTGFSNSPKVDDQIPDQKFIIGKYYRQKISKHAFSDCEDGNTKSLKLSMFRYTQDVIPSDFWLQFDSKFKHMNAMPMASDIGQYTFTLVAMDTDGYTVSQTFDIEVIADPDELKEYSQELSITIDHDYDDFMSDFENRLKLSTKLSRYYGDGKHPHLVHVNRLAAGSVIYAWSNSSLPTDHCSLVEINAIVNKAINEDGTINEGMKKGLHPYVIKSAKSTPGGVCLLEADFPTRDTSQPATTPEPTVDNPEPVPEKPDVMPNTDDSTTAAPGSKVDKSQDSSDDEIWITTVVPAVVIIAILLLALVIACILYRKKRKGKMSLEDQHTFNNKGVPVIFADELDEKPNDSSKPLIMDDEKPPLPPPVYKRGSSESAPSTPPTEPRDPFEEHELDDATSPLYQPPPPVTTSGNNKQPKHVQPAYRNPPPYVPP